MVKKLDNGDTGKNFGPGKKKKSFFGLFGFGDRHEGDYEVKAITQDVELLESTPAEPDGESEVQGAAGTVAMPVFQVPDFSGAEDGAPTEIPKPQEKKNKPKASGTTSKTFGGKNGSSKNGNARENKNKPDKTVEIVIDESITAHKRRKRRKGSSDVEFDTFSEGDPKNTVTRVRAPRGLSTPGPKNERVKPINGSARLQAQKQRRREGREFSKRSASISEAERISAYDEPIERRMVVRQGPEHIQIAVLEDGVLAEHFVSNTLQNSLIGNIYLGRVQNVLPSMEAAFIDIGKGRNAVLYAGEVNWDELGVPGERRRIENALNTGDTVLVQVTKNAVGQKGARLTSQVSLPGRYLVYVPGTAMTGISRRLPEAERQRLKQVLRENLPEKAGVIVRTAAEGASEQELRHDINRLRTQWESIESEIAKRKDAAPHLLYAEPDVTVKVVRDVFSEHFSELIVSGEKTWDEVEAYVTYVAPDLLGRLKKWDAKKANQKLDVGNGLPINPNHDGDIFEYYRINEQIAKALERKVYLPSGGSLVIDSTEAMTVIDVNTGRFIGSGGNLEETVTKNNLEAAEEVARQLRLRDIGGIIVIDFIDMVLESNRDLVLRRFVECLGRDHTRHQVAEVTSLGLVQMTRKRVGSGLLEVFSDPCEACGGRGVVTGDMPLQVKHSRNDAIPAPLGNDSEEVAVYQSVTSKEERKKKESARLGLNAIAAASNAKRGTPQAKTVKVETIKTESSGHSAANSDGSLRQESKVSLVEAVDDLAAKTAAKGLSAPEDLPDEEAFRKNQDSLMSSLEAALDEKEIAKTGSRSAEDRGTEEETLGTHAKEADSAWNRPGGNGGDSQAARPNHDSSSRSDRNSGTQKCKSGNLTVLGVGVPASEL